MISVYDIKFVPDRKGPKTVLATVRRPRAAQPILQWGVHVKSHLRWVAAPGGDIVVPDNHTLDFAPMGDLWRVRYMLDGEGWIAKGSGGLLSKFRQSREDVEWCYDCDLPKDMCSVDIDT